MAVELALRTDDEGRVRPFVGDRPLAGPTPLGALSPEARAELEAAEPDAAPLPAGALPADLPAELRAQLEAAAEEMARLDPEERAELEAQAQEFTRRLQAMSPEERAELEAAAWAAAGRDQIQSLADQASDGALAALRGETEAGPLAARLEEVAARAAEGEEAGSPRQELAAYLRAVAALLRGEAVPPVPAAYAGHLAAIQAARQS